MKYIHRHPHRFERLTVPIIVCYFKLIIECVLEVVCMIITARYTDAKDIVMNYISLGVISELDEIYYAHIVSRLKQDLEDREGMSIPIQNHSKLDIHYGLHWVDRLLLHTVNFVYLLYDVLYFHMSVYFIFLLLIFWKGNKTDYNADLEGREH